MKPYYDQVLKFLAGLDLASLPPGSLNQIIRACHIIEVIVAVLLSWALTKPPEQRRKKGFINWRLIEFVSGCVFIIFVFLIGDTAKDFKDNADKASQTQAQIEFLNRSLDRLSGENR